MVIFIICIHLFCKPLLLRPRILKKNPINPEMPMSCMMPRWLWKGWLGQQLSSLAV